MSPPRTRQPVQPESPPRAFRNRIVGHGEEAPAQLLANPRNWRVHPGGQQDALAAVLDRVGWVQQVIVNQRTGFVVDGHLRVALAITKNEPVVPVTYIDIDEAEEALVLATFDPIAAMAGADKAQLELLLRDLQGEDGALRNLLDSLALEQGIDLYGEPATDPGAQIDLAAELQKKWGTELGQVWQVGDHRVMCGDSTSEADVGALMAGGAAAAVFTDPPYGISYDSAATGRSTKRWAAIEGDDLRGDALQDFNRAFLAIAAKHLMDDGVLYVCGADKTAHRLIAAAEDLGIQYAVPIIWVKQNFAMNWDRYHPQHEFIFYGGPGSVPTGAKSRWFGPKNETTVWQVDRDAAADYKHPTQKPIELAARAIRNSSKQGEIVLDLFLGSGMTLVACEQLRRRGYGMEIDAGYVAVTLERLAGMGLEPVLETAAVEA